MTSPLRLIDVDAEHEGRIRRAYERCLRVWNREAWLELVRLIRQRSPQQVARMERERGLS